ncbi:MAG: cytochrome C [Steroidobacteraceae bacterium]|nr:cytochrome C [Deltaproteobacteria bacterium]
MKRILAAAALVTLCSSMSLAAGITNTKHDLSSVSTTTGPKAATQTQICVFCHTPHNAIKNVPLWNRTGGTAAASFKLYTSSASLTQADGVKSALYDDSISLFCLSCHDGTVAQLGSRVVRPGAVAMSGNTWTGGDATTGPAMLGSDLTQDHPIGFTYPSAGEANRLTTADAARTTMNLNNGASPDSSAIFFSSNGGARTNQMECASCHMVHDNTNSPFLRSSNSGSILCLACHIK